jgi:predicted amidophosphoribosyltransferase
VIVQVALFLCVVSSPTFKLFKVKKMKADNLCPCCSEPLLRHARHGSVYWFCSHCWQEMPNLQQVLAARRMGKQIGLPVGRTPGRPIAYSI